MALIADRGYSPDRIRREKLTFCEFCHGRDHLAFFECYGCGLDVCSHHCPRSGQCGECGAGFDNLIYVTTFREPTWYQDAYPIVFSNECGHDHVRGFRDIVIYQPYSARGEHLQEMLSSLLGKGFEVRFNGVTTYRPPLSLARTFSILICRPKDRDQVGEFVYGAERGFILDPHDSDLPPRKEKL